MTDEELKSYLIKVDGLIKRYGWIVQGVFPTRPEEGPFFAYTVGMHELGLPELIIFGLDAERSQILLNDACNFLKKEGAPEDFDLEDRLITNFSIAYRILNPELAALKHLVMAKNRYGHAVRATQIVWPDEKGLFPWQAGCNPRDMNLQNELLPRLN